MPRGLLASPWLAFARIFPILACLTLFPMMEAAAIVMPPPSQPPVDTTPKAPPKCPGSVSPSAGLGQFCQGKGGGRVASIRDFINAVCPGCSIGANMVQIAYDIGKNSMSALASKVLGLILVGVALWMAIRIGRAWLSVPSESLAHWKDILGTIARLTLVGAIISPMTIGRHGAPGAGSGGAFDFLFDYIVGPIMLLGMGLGTDLLNGIDGIALASASGSAGSMIMDVKQGMVDLIYSMQSVLATGMAIGVWMMGKIGLSGIGLAYFVTGLLLTAIYVVLYLKFLYLLISGVVRFLIVLILSPAILGAYVFPFTKNIAGAALRNIVYSSILMFTLSAGFAIIGGVYVSVTVPVSFNGISGTCSTICEMVNDENMRMADSFGDVFPFFLFLIVMAIGGWIILSLCETIAGELAEFGANIAMGSLAPGVGGMVARGAGRAGMAAGRATGRGLKAGYRAIRNRLRGGS